MMNFNRRNDRGIWLPKSSAHSLSLNVGLCVAAL